MSYTLLKSIHVLTVVLSIGFFFVRGVWMIGDSGMLQRTWVRVTPHVNDTVLLISAIALTFEIDQYPFVQGWLTAKVIGLLVYIALGTVALRRGKTKTVRVSAWIGALAVFAYIVLVAIHHDPLPTLQ